MTAHRRWTNLGSENTRRSCSSFRKLLECAIIVYNGFGRNRRVDDRDGEVFHHAYTPGS